MENPEDVETIPERHCHNCLYFEKLPAFKKQDGNKNGGIGNCLANPPVPAVGPEGKRAVAQFPMVVGNMVCGIHETK